MESYQFFGYDRKDGTHVMGTSEIASGQYDIYSKTAARQQQSESGRDLAAHFMTMAPTAGYDYRSDGKADKLLQQHWEDLGNTGKYTDEFAEKQYRGATMGETDRIISTIKGEDWYKQLPLDQKAERAPLGCDQLLRWIVETFPE